MAFGILDDKDPKNKNTQGQSLMGAIRGTNNPANINKMASPGAGAPEQFKAIQPAQANQTPMAPQPMQAAITSAQPAAPVQEPKGTINQFVPSAQPSMAPAPAPQVPAQNQQPQTYTGSLLNQLGSREGAQAAYDPTALQSAILGRGGATRGEANFNAKTLTNDATFNDQAAQVNNFAYQNAELNKQLAAQKAATEKAQAEAAKAAEVKAATDKATADAAKKAEDDRKAAQKAEEDRMNAQLLATSQAKKAQEEAAKEATKKSQAQAAQVVTPVAPPAIAGVAPVTQATQASVQRVPAQSLTQAITGTPAAPAVPAAPAAPAPQAPTAAPAVTPPAPVAPVAPPAPVRITAENNFDPSTGQMSPEYERQLAGDLERMSNDPAFQDKDGNLDPSKIRAQLMKDYPEVMKDQDGKAMAARAAAQAEVEAAQAKQQELAATQQKINQDLQTARQQSQQTAQQVAQAQAQSQRQSQFADFLSKSFTDTRTGRVFNGDYTTLANFLNDPEMNALYSRAVQGESMAGLNQIAAQKAQEAQMSLQNATAQQKAQNDFMNNLMKQQADTDRAAKEQAAKLAATQAATVKAQQDAASAQTQALYNADQARMAAANKQGIADQAARGINNAKDLTRQSLVRSINSDNPLESLARMGVTGAATALANQNAAQQAQALRNQMIQGGVSNNIGRANIGGNQGGLTGGNIGSTLGGVAAGALGLPPGLGKLAGGILGKIL